LKRIRLTREEKAIEAALLRGEYQPVSPDKFRAIAKAIEEKRKDAILHIRMNRCDLESLKQKARHLGVPYQTFISELLHRCAI
jgi:predicted DNA binding CopG/RHH family protein